MTLECKRRKIKCDRTQPCAPCTRRGEEAGCQWHIVEPVSSSIREKYATKAEFDELKARFEQLAALVQRFIPAAAAPTPSQPYYQMGVQPAMPGVAGEAVQAYTPGTSNPMGYPTLMPPPQPPQQQQPYSQHMETTPLASSRYMKPEGAQSPTRHQQHQSVNVPTTSAGSMSSGLHNNPSSLPRHRAETSPSSTAATLKSSPLSLSVITSPFNRPEPTSSTSSSQHTAAETQPKNYHAQTLILGERLRPGSEDPTNFFGRTRLQTSVEVRRQRSVIIRLLARRCSSIAPQLRRRRGQSPHQRTIPNRVLWCAEPLLMNRLRVRWFCLQEKTKKLARAYTNPVAATDDELR
ncbi:hypothetical protein CVT25_001234 [Psilocybe cyanescens]|uniref:Zn(2)-C6 fungal-type domain-containing protein n=1 Tax=Psilocybe cyanescens TaxID=93625 RepID=A0A409XAU7_PSICY|nr:hypothetical protein CVT25_001234 [Psilocybe cyanescens]